MKRTSQELSILRKEATTAMLESLKSPEGTKGTAFKDARSLLLESVYPLIVSYISKRCKRKRDIQDAVSAAALNVLENVHKYDPKRGSITNYVCKLAFGGMTRHLYNSHLIHIPEYLQRNGGEEQKHDEHARRAATVSGFAYEIPDRTPDYDWAEREAAADVLNECIESLEITKPKEALIIKSRYGIGGEREQTLEEVGQRINVTRECVRINERKAMQSLRARLASRKVFC